MPRSYVDGYIEALGRRGTELSEAQRMRDALREINRWAVEAKKEGRLMGPDKVIRRIELAIGSQHSKNWEKRDKEESS